MVTLEGVNAKLQRAQDQIEHLAGDVTESCETQQDLFSEELRPDVGDRIWVFRGETPAVPIEYSVRVGEIVYNLRSTLDQLIWQLVHANYKAPNHHNEFPIFEDETRFNNAVKTKLCGVSQQSMARIKEMQPFSNNDKWSALKTVHSLCNIDKHRESIFPFYDLDRCSTRFLGGGNPNVKPRIHSFRSNLRSNLRKDFIVYSVEPLDAVVEIKLFVDMKLSGSDGLDPKRYLDMESNERQVSLVLKDCLSTVLGVVDCLSGEIQKHPLFGRRPSFQGLKAIEYSLERSPDAPNDDRDDLVRQLFKDFGEL